MAFTANTFGPIGGQSRKGSVPQMWGYKTEDAATAVDASGYANAVAGLVAPGDLVYRVTVNSSGVVQNVGWHVVVSNAAGVVDLSDTVAIAITDSD